MKKVSTSSRSMPSSELRKVFWMVTREAVLTPLVKDSEDRAGRPDQSMVSTEDSLGKLRAERMVSSVRVKVSIDSRLSALREVS